MGDPAIMSKDERAQANAIASAIVDAVIDDGADPLEALAIAAEQRGIPAETALLWLAQLLDGRYRGH